MKQQKMMYPFIGICMFLAQAKSQVFYGDVKVQDTTIAQDVKIVGVGKAKNTVFDQNVSVIGFLSSESNHFLSDLHLTGSDLLLKNDLVEGDVHVTNYVRKPKLRMQDSTIKGKVIFHSRKAGVVIKDSNSVIGEGVENGDVQ